MEPFTFLFTALIEIEIARESTGIFTFLLAIFVVLFLIYSIVPFIKEIKEKKITLDGSLLRLFGANIVVFLTVTSSLFYAYELNSKSISIITISTALYLFAYAFYLKREGIFTKNLYLVIIAMALGLLLLTPIILFEGDVLSATWAIEAMILYWVAYKSEQPRMLWFSLVAFALSFIVFMMNDLESIATATMQTYYHDMLTQLITALIVIGAFLLPYKLPKQSLEGYELKMLLSAGGVFTFYFLQCPSL